jgi:small subunit ribosomal protein S6
VNVYENVVIIDANLSDEATEESIQKIQDQVAAKGGETLKVDRWGKRKMAYEINKHSKGLYILFLFKCPADTISEMETYYKVTDGIVKYMFIRLEKKPLEAALKSLAAAEAAAEAAAAAPAPEEAAPEAAAAEEAPAAEAEPAEPAAPAATETPAEG